MSHENVEIVRALNDSFNAGEEDWPRFYHPEAEFHMPREWPEDRVYYGPEGVKKGGDAWNESFDEYRWDVDELIDVGDSVVALVHHRGRIGGSTEWIEREVGAIFEVHSGQVTKVRAFLSWDEAREAAGLSS
jgi:hypothetical protein